MLKLMSEYIVIVSKKTTRYNGWNTTPSTIRNKSILQSSLHAQECTHMNNTAFLVSRFKKKKKNRPTDPPHFQAKRANKPYIFLGLILGIVPFILFGCI